MKIYYDKTTAQTAQTVFPMEQARMLSAHEGSMAVTQGGDSLFRDVRIRSRDERAILQWVKDALRMIEVRLRSALLSAVYTTTDCTLAFKDRYTVRDTPEMADEAAYAAANYALSRWLEIRQPEKASAYLERFSDRMERIAQFCLRKDVPTLSTT